MYTVDEKMEKDGGFRNLASEYSGMIFENTQKVLTYLFSRKYHLYI